MKSPFGGARLLERAADEHFTVGRYGDVRRYDQVMAAEWGLPSYVTVYGVTTTVAVALLIVSVIVVLAMSL